MNEETVASPAGPLLRLLKGRGALLTPSVFVGKAGLSTELMQSLDTELTAKELVKVKFVAFKDEKKELVKELVARSGSHLVMRVGNVAVLYRRHSDPSKRKFEN